MPTESELIEAIKECESKESSYDNCVKLAIFYQLLDRYYPKKKEINKKSFDSEKNKDSIADIIYKSDYDKIINLFIEVMKCLKVINPKLYESIAFKLKNQAILEEQE